MGFTESVKVMQANFLRSRQKVFEPDPFLMVREECRVQALVVEGFETLTGQVAGLGWVYENV